VLIATLGAQPQVPPIATQLLLRDQVPLTTVEVLHTNPTQEPIRSALQELRTTFDHSVDWPALTLTEIPCNDVLTPHELDTFSTTLFHSLKHWVGLGHQIHLLLAGGRKPMAMIGMSVAQLLLGPQDRVWYLFSDDELRQSGRVTVRSNDDVRLIQIPLPQFTSTPALFSRPFQAETPAAARRELAEADAQRRRYFVEEELTPVERTIAQHLAREILTTDELARRLHKSPKTITNQLNTIYNKLESYFGLQPDKGVKREFLRQLLSAYFDGSTNT
jgi:DNA-binding CsgD family transcriptional regulator